MKYVINGSFLTENIMGVQRYAYEILIRADRMLAAQKSESAKKLQNIELEILVPDENVPENERKSTVFQFIKAVHLGSSAGKKWDQVTYARYLRKHHAKGISMCNSVPIFAKTAAVCVDAIVFKTNPEFFTEKGAWHEILYRKLMYCKAFHSADQVMTCSEFSRKQIQDHYRLKNSDITVITNAWQHYDVSDVDEGIFEKDDVRKSYQQNQQSDIQGNIRKDYGSRIQRGEYYFFLSSLAKNKNLPWILENAKRNPDTTYVLAGSFLGDDSGVDQLGNVIYVGRVSDAEARALYKYCKAFIFPSIYEGFGIPPMEALCMGASIIISDIPVFQRIYGDAAHYINPMNADVKLDEILKEPVEPAETVLSQYSWENSAKTLIEVLQKL